MTLSNPARRNAISEQMYAQLQAACAGIAADSTLRAVILRGDGGAFAGGTDINDLVAIRSGADGVEYEARMRMAQAGLLQLRIPIIAVVDGACVGGGLVLAALSDLVLCTPRAVFGSPIARTLGNTLSPTSIARLNELFGRRLAARMLLTAELIPADVAAAAGFVTAIVDPEDIDAAAVKIAREIAVLAPLTIRSIKEFSQRIDTAQLASVRSDDVYDLVYGSADFAEGVDAFLGKRAARFSGT